MSEALRAVDIYEGIGATKNAENCKTLFRDIEKKKKNPAASGESGSGSEFLETMLLSMSFDPQFSARGSGHHPTSLFRRILR